MNERPYVLYVLRNLNLTFFIDALDAYMCLYPTIAYMCIWMLM